MKNILKKSCLGQMEYFGPNLSLKMTSPLRVLLNFAQRKGYMRYMKIILINYMVLVLKNKPNLAPILARERQVHITRDPPL